MSEDNTTNDLWRKFSEQRLKEGNLNDYLDLPAIFKNIPEGVGKTALDLGCGLGQASFKLAEKLNYLVTAVDGSNEMMTHAKSLYSGSRINWLEARFEKLSFQNQSFDLVVACLSFHFVSDLISLLKQIACWLKPGGLLVFSVRHPIRTANPNGELITGDGVSWQLNSYFAEGQRQFKWLGADCINYHRTLSTYLRYVQEAGLQLDTLEEPNDLGQTYEFSAESYSVPFLLTIVARKT